MLIKERLARVLALFAVIYTSLVGLLLYHQVLHGPETARQAAALHSRRVPVEEIPRGDILDRNGLPLTGQNMVWAVYCLPRLVEDVWGTSLSLARMLDLRADRVEKRITRAKRQGTFFLLLKCPVTRAEKEELNKERPAGVFCAPLKRRYPADGFCIHVLGQVALPAADPGRKDLRNGDGAFSEDGWVGVSGIEKRYEEVLRNGGSAEELVAVLGADGKVIPGLLGEVRRSEKARAGKDVVLTIDKRVQQVVERAMDRAVKKGAVVVMDVETRDVLAMASRPAYNPYQAEEFLRDAGDSPFLNRALEPYHPGSVFKLVVAAAALEEKLVAPGETFLCSGSYDFNGRVSIACWKKEGHGPVTMKEALAQSCNSAFIQIASRVGREGLLDYVAKLHLLDPVVLGYPGVGKQGNVHIEPAAPALGNASIGQQGVVLSPLAVASLLATVGDDGQWAPPRMVLGVREAHGAWERTCEQVPKKQVLSLATARSLQAMLREAVEKGTGQRARMTEASCAGKTATCQTGRFHPDGREVLHTWFTGYVPADHPRWVIVVLMEDGVSGGQSCAPVFKEIAQGMLKNVPIVP